MTVLLTIVGVFALTYLGVVLFVGVLVYIDARAEHGAPVFHGIFTPFNPERFWAMVEERAKRRAYKLNEGTEQ